MSDFPLLKDQIDTHLVTQIAGRIQHIYPDFVRDDFISAVEQDLHPLELKPRFRLIAEKLYQYLPANYRQAVHILVDILDDTRYPFEHIEDIGFRLLSIPTFVEHYGVDDFDASMDAMYIITRYTSCEFAIRPFIERYPQQTMQRLHEWVHDDNEHVRRLVSEGTRPRLPWAPQLPDFITDPSPTIELLNHLKDDPSLYVRRSVANHLNDIAKDHPDITLDTVEAWSENASEGTQWLISHALRTLVKNGNKRALKLLGFGKPDVLIANLNITPQKLHYGDALTITFDITNTTKKAQNLMVDYIIHFVKANGKTAPKVFKLKKVKLAPQEHITIEKSHSIRPISTRKYYAGTHPVDIQINGQVMSDTSFELVIDE